jgi:hypothetical protein
VDADRRQSELVLARWIFVRALGAIFALAFASLWLQIDGLVGSRGILPIGEYLGAVRERYGSALVRQLPTMCWWSASDASLHAQCGVGTACSLALCFGLAPRLNLALAWLLYLSLSVAGQDFLWFQWDALLLEAAFFAFFFAPGGWRSTLAKDGRPPPWSVFLVRWLCFRLMLASGAVKLTSGDATWRALTALEFHYQTQPIPTPLAWYAHHLPDGWQRASCAIMFAIELGLPWFALGPRRMRIAAGLGLVLLQVLIALTGNYGSFNLLAIVLCVPLFDDALLARVLPRAWMRRLPGLPPARATEPAVSATSRWRGRGGWAFAIGLACMTAAMLVSRLDRSLAAMDPLRRVEAWIAPLRTLNTYGLFAVMTTERDEITIEGSRDGIEWRAYEFRYKPGDLGRAPPWVAPHMPRLDWQMWFAALGRVRDNFWFQRLLERLLEGSEPVLALFEKNPFEDSPPKLVRARLSRYAFTSADQRAESGAWWTSSSRGSYAPTVSLSDFARH